MVRVAGVVCQSDTPPASEEPKAISTSLQSFSRSTSRNASDRRPQATIVGPAMRGQGLVQFRHQCKVGCRKGAHADDMHIVLDGLPRRLNRVTVAGDVPVGIEGKESYSIAGDASHYTSVATYARRAGMVEPSSHCARSVSKSRRSPCGIGAVAAMSCSPLWSATTKHS